MLLVSTLGFVLKRAWHRRTILLPVVLATLGVVTILAGVPLFSEAATSVGLSVGLHTPGPAVARNLEILISAPAQAPDGYQRLSDATTGNARAHLGDLVPQSAAIIRRGEAAGLALYPSGDAQAFPRHRLDSTNLWFTSGTDATHLKLLQGHLPSAAVTSTQTAQGLAWDVEVMISPAWADTFALKLNDIVEVADPVNAPASSLRLHVVGFFQPKNLKDPLWFDELDPFTEPISVADEPLPAIPIWLNEAAFHAALPQLGSKTKVLYSWLYYLHLDAISPANVDQTISNLLSLKDEFALPNLGIPSQQLSVSVLSQLDTLLQAFLQALFFVTLGTLVAILPGILLLLLYLGIAAAALAEQSREELAMMKSRGASRWQLLSLTLLEALLLCGTALLVAPLLAGQVIALLARHGFFGASSGPPTATGAPSFPAYLYAGAAALVCLLALLLPAPGAIRASLLNVKQRLSRPRPRSWWLRLGPGALLTALGAFGYIEIRQRGAFFTQNLQGDFAVDWVAAVSPTLLLLGIAGVSLLLVPAALALGDLLAQRLPGIAASLALRQMARRPAPYSRLVLLLALTMALGVCTSLFNGSLSSSFDDRASYMSGADLRLEEGSIVLPDYDRQAASLQDHLSLLPGVQDGMNSFRLDSILPSHNLKVPHATVLGIDTARFAQLAYWRADFANTPLPRLLGALQRPVSQEETLPAIVNDQLLSQAGLHLGSEMLVQLGAYIGVNFVIIGSFHYFPTLDTNHYNVVCDLNRLLTLLHQGLVPNAAPNEVWLKLAANAPDYTAEQVEARFEANPQHRQIVVSVLQAFDRRELGGLLRDDPLQLSISGALTLDFSIAALLSVVGFIVLFSLLAQQRAFEFGVLRAMGLSLRQLLAALGCEQLTLLLLALLLGIPLGALVASVTLPPLSTDESGAPLLPPIADRLNPQLIAQQGLLLLACLCAVATATALIFRYLRLNATLQLGEE